MELSLIFVFVIIFPGNNINAGNITPKTFTNITVIAGQTAFLNCKLNVTNSKVIWIRDRDNKLISYGLEAFASSKRFVPIRTVNSSQLTLKIMDAQKSDAGFYQCYVGSNSSIRAYVYLNVNRPKLKLLGVSNEIYVGLGSSLNLNCIIESGPTSTNRITWFHNEQEIHFDRHKLEWNEF